MLMSLWCPCCAECVRRVGEPPANHRRQRERCVRQPEPYRQYQPVPVQRVLL